MKRVLFALFLIVSASTGAAAFSPGATGFSLTIMPGLDCDGTFCRNEWNECFLPVPDAEGIVNVDTMGVVSCNPRSTT